MKEFPSGSGWNAVVAEAQAENSGSGHPLYHSTMLEAKSFEGDYTPTRRMALAIFSDDGSDVTVDGTKVWGGKGKGQALPPLDQSLHKLPTVTLEANTTHHIKIDYSNTYYDGDGDTDGVTLFAYDASPEPIVINLVATSDPLNATYHNTSPAPVNVSTVKVYLDGNDVTANATITPTSASLQGGAVDLSEDHTFKVVVGDTAGNTVSASADQNRFDAEAEDTDVRTTMSFGYTMPRDGQVSIKIINVATGKQLRSMSGSRASGSVSDTWDGKDDAGNIVPNGIYEIDVNYVTDDGSNILLCKIDPEAVSYQYIPISINGGSFGSGSTNSTFHDRRFKFYCPSDGEMAINLNAVAGDVTMYLYKFATKSRIGAIQSTGSWTTYPSSIAPGGTIQVQGPRWYYIRVVSNHHDTRSFQFTNNFDQYGDLSSIHRPWNFWYWPYYASAVSDNITEVLMQNLNTKSGALNDAPLSKYDAVYGTSTQSNHLVMADNIPGAFWTGHCDGACISSIMLDEPIGKLHTLSTGSSVNFTSNDLKGLYSELACGGFHPGSYMQITDNNNQITPQASASNNWPAKIHNVLYTFLVHGSSRFSLVMTNLGKEGGTNDNAEVWNQVIYKYKAKFFGVSGSFQDRHLFKIINTITTNADKLPLTFGDSTSRIDVWTYILEYQPFNGSPDPNSPNQKWLSVETGLENSQSSGTYDQPGYLPSYMTTLAPSQPWDFPDQYNSNNNCYGHVTPGLTKSKVDGL